MTFSGIIFIEWLTDSRSIYAYNKNMTPYLDQNIFSYAH